MPTIETDDGVAIHFETTGSSGRPPLMMSNSLGSDLTMWDREAELLSDAFFVVRYDSRGHGRSGVPEGPYAMERLAHDAINLMDALEIHRTCWCGLSMGGMVGMWIASRHTDRIGRLALCNTAAHMPPKALWDGRIRTATGDGMEPLVEPTMERWFTAPFRADPANRETLDRVRAMVRGTNPAGYAGCCAAIRDMDQRHTIARIRAPCLVVTGRDDPATPPDYADLIARTIEGARLHVFEDCAHISNIERPVAFHETVLPFLRAAA